MTNITYVTALYSIETPDKRDHAKLDARIDLLKELFLLNIPIIAFLDPDYKDQYDFSMYSNVKILYKPLSFFLFWRLCKNPLHLPPMRNPGKDTQDFLALMNTKIEFVKEALEYINTPNVAWIDASIYHIISNKEKVKEALEKPVTLSNHRVRIPGPNSLTNRIEFEELFYRIQWKFCGGFFQGTKEGMCKFYERSYVTLIEWCNRGYLTWEVNLWIDMAQENPEVFEWVYGDHNDSMLLVNEP